MAGMVTDSGDSGKKGHQGSHSRLGPGRHWGTMATPAQPALWWVLGPSSTPEV